MLASFKLLSLLIVYLMQINDDGVDNEEWCVIRCSSSRTEIVLLRPTSWYSSLTECRTIGRWLGRRRWLPGRKESQYWLYVNSLITFYTLCLKKTRKLWNGIARNYKDRFCWHLAEFTIKVGRRTASTGCWWSWESSEQCGALPVMHFRTNIK